jgi:inosine-uridine nucleoside N-ribohydrolase
MTRKPILLDTDIGTDVDDLLALSLVLMSPGVALDVDIERAERFIVDRLAR